MPKWLVILILTLIVGMTACSPMAVNNIQSPELSVDTMTIVARQEGAYYLVIFDLSPELPDDSWAVISYQSLNNPQKYKTLEIGNIGDSRRITFKSKPDKTIHSNTNYQLMIQLFSSADKGRLIAQRSIGLMANIPSNVAEILDIQLL